MRNVYSDINSLEEVIFIGGTEYTLEFNVLDEDSLEVDLTGATVKWTMSYYGQPDYAVLTKNGTITDTNTFQIILASSDTEDLEGKFVHQPIVIDFGGGEFRPAQGVITIISKINNA